MSERAEKPLMSFEVTAYKGRDVYLYLLPCSWQARVVARKLFSSSWAHLDPETTELRVIVQYEVFKVLDKTGKVQKLDESKALSTVPTSGASPVG